MTEQEVHNVMTFLNAEYREPVTKERRLVWTEMLKDVSYDDGILAAKVLLARSNKFAGINEFLKAVAEVKTPHKERETWGEAWDKWINTANKFGSYRQAEAAREYQEISPRGANVIKSCLGEWFLLPTEDVPIFRAQFRQRYEAAAAKAHHQRVLPRDVQRALGYEIIAEGGAQGIGNILQIAGKK